jgi:hypothetical protein
VAVAAAGSLDVALSAKGHTASPSPIKLEAALKDALGIDARFEKISRMLRQNVQQATMLARGLRLLPISSIDKRQPPESPHPIPDRRLHLQAVPDDDIRGADVERDFARLRERMHGASFRPPPRAECGGIEEFAESAANSLRRVQKATEDADVVAFVGASATRGMMMATEAADA